MRRLADDEDEEQAPLKGGVCVVAVGADIETVGPTPKAQAKRNQLAREVAQGGPRRLALGEDPDDNLAVDDDEGVALSSLLRRQARRGRWQSGTSLQPVVVLLSTPSHSGHFAPADDRIPTRHALGDRTTVALGRVLDGDASNILRPGRVQLRPMLHEHQRPLRALLVGVALRLMRAEASRILGAVNERIVPRVHAHSVCKPIRTSGRDTADESRRLAGEGSERALAEIHQLVAGLRDKSTTPGGRQTRRGRSNTRILRMFGGSDAARQRRFRHGLQPPKSERRVLLDLRLLSAGRPRAPPRMTASSQGRRPPRRKTRSAPRRAKSAQEGAADTTIANFASHANTHFVLAKVDLLSIGDLVVVHDHLHPPARCRNQPRSPSRRCPLKGWCT